jgi:hypothetical protein
MNACPAETWQACLADQAATQAFRMLVRDADGRGLGGRAPRGWCYFTKYQFSGLMLSVELCGVTPLRLSATSVRV